MPHAAPSALEVLTADYLATLDSQDTYTPVLTATTTNPNLGADGEASGWWHRTGHWIAGAARIRGLGSGISVGSGSLRVTLPFPYDASLVNATAGAGLSHTFGTGFHRHTTAGSSHDFVVQPTAADTISVSFVFSGSNSQLTAAALSSTEFRLSFQFTYPADPAGL